MTDRNGPGVTKPVTGCAICAAGLAESTHPCPAGSTDVSLGVYRAPPEPPAPAPRRRPRPRPLAGRPELNPRERRGLIFALRANGARWGAVARALRVSVGRVRQLELEVTRAIHAAADRRFGPPEESFVDWAEVAEAERARRGMRCPECNGAKRRWEYGGGGARDGGPCGKCAGRGWVERPPAPPARSPFHGIHRSFAGPEQALRAVLGIAVLGPNVTPALIPVMQRTIIRVLVSEDVEKRERATALPDGGIGGRGDARFGETYPDRVRLDAWWLRAYRKGEVGRLKVGEPPTEAELEGE